MRILFWGTPDFAAPPLRALIGEGFDVVGVVTQPDRPQGRHHHTLVPSAIKVIAFEEGVPVLQPERPRGEEFMAAMTALAPDISIVVAYGHILRQEVIDLPSRGTLNIHGSLLPRWRGAAPIQASILAGDGETGVTVMRMVRALDAGPMLLKAPTPILDDETYGELQLRLSELGALAIVEAMALLSIGDPAEIPQDEALVTHAPKIEREHARIDWTLPCEQVARAIRAFDPRPGAFTTLRGQDLKLFGVRPLSGFAGDPGDILRVEESGMLVGCGAGAVRISYAQPSGKRRMPVLDLAQGRVLSEADTLGE